MTYLAAGTCTVTASQAGTTGSYDPAAMASLSITVAAAVPALGRTGVLLLAVGLLTLGVVSRKCL